MEIHATLDKHKRIKSGHHTNPTVYTNGNRRGNRGVLCKAITLIVRVSSQTVLALHKEHVIVKCIYVLLYELVDYINVAAV